MSSLNIKSYKAGSFTKQYGYKSFHPNLLNKEWVIDNPEIHTLLEDANYKLGQLNAFSIFIRDVDVFIKKAIKMEADTMLKKLHF